MASKVLFVCVENAGRSLMAEAFMKKYAPHMAVSSAGTRPAPEPNGMVVRAMAEAGVDVRATPKAITAGMLRDSVVVNMGCVDQKSCPALFVDGVYDWGIPDPRGKDLGEVRRIRDMIDARVRELAESLA